MVCFVYTCPVDRVASVIQPSNNWVRGPFFEGPENFSHPESHSKISNVMITALFYSQILDINRGSLYTRRFRRMHLSVFRYGLTKNGFADPKVFGAFEKQAPGSLLSGNMV